MLKDRLKLIRAEYGFNKTEMARFLGVSQVTYCRYERLATLPKPFVLKKIANRLGMTVEQLVMVNEGTVEHPGHYKVHKNECWDEMIALFGVDEFCIFAKLNAWKYRYRADAKNGAEDLNKADAYIDKIMELRGLKNEDVQEMRVLE